jgi:hypothetical protein
MTAKFHFYQTLFGFVVAFCAINLGVSGERNDIKTVAGYSNLIAQSKNHCQLQQELQQRTQQYLESLRHRSAHLSDELRIKIESQSQTTVKSGLAKLNQPAKLVKKQAENVDLTILSRLAQKIKKSAAWNTAAFLSRDFHRPNEWEVAIHIAVPHWNRLQRFGRFFAQNPVKGTLFGDFGLDFASCNAVVVPTTPRDSKSLATILGQLFLSATVTENKNTVCGYEDTLCSGFTLIAQTVIRRE